MKGRGRGEAGGVTSISSLSPVSVLFYRWRVFRLRRFVAGLDYFSGIRLLNHLRRLLLHPFSHFLGLFTVRVLGCQIYGRTKFQFRVDVQFTYGQLLFLHGRKGTIFSGLLEHGTVFLVVDRLFFAPANYFIRYRTRAIYCLIDVRCRLPVRVSNDASDHLHRQAIQTRRAFLVDVRSDSRESFQRVGSFARRISTSRRIRRPFPRVVRSLGTFRHVSVTVSVITTSSRTHRVDDRFLHRALHRYHRRGAFIRDDALYSLLRRVISLIRHQARLSGQVRRTYQASRLIRRSPFTLFRFVINQYHARMGHRQDRQLRLVRHRQAIVRHYQRARAVVRRVLLAKVVTSMRHPCLQSHRITLIGRRRGIFQRVVRRAREPFAHLTAIGVTKVILSAKTVPRLTCRFRVGHSALMRAFHLMELTSFPRRVRLHPRVSVSLPSDNVSAFLNNRRGINQVGIRFVLLICLLPNLQIRQEGTVRLVIPGLGAMNYPVGDFSDQGSVSHVPICAGTPPIRLCLVVSVGNVRRATRRFVPICPRPLLRVRRFLDGNYQIHRAVRTKSEQGSGGILPPQRR